MAAIHAQFPESGIIKRMQVVHHLEAQQFFSQWPDVVRAADDTCDADVQLSSKFNEEETRNAFLALSARFKNLEEVTKANQEHLSTINRRTEQFSPSKPQAKVQRLPPTASVPQPSTHFIPHGLFPTSTPSESPLQFPIPTASSASTGQISVIGGCASTVTPLPVVQHLASTSSLVSLPRPSLPSPRVSSQSSLITASPTHMPMSVCSPQFTSGRVSEPLTPYIVTRGRQSFCVLPLIPQVPGQDQVKSSHDLVLPPAEAFSALNTPLPPAYPLFHTHNCTWNSVLSLVQQPPLLWPVYAPKNLGEYSDIMSLWRTWEEGMSIEDVGCTPPLRLIDERWGSCIGQRVRWRPHGDPLVSVSHIMVL
jgi:hypothetical protein